jgi:uncharacterized protein (DUF58 family)
MAETAVDALFDREFLKRLEALSLAARQLVRGRMKAERRSSVHGSSIEFAEYRPFTQGDDFRYIDWNAFARWRQLVLKLFVEEQDLYVHFLLDGTASMNWGDPVKFDYARQVVAGLGYLGLSNLDRVSVVPLGAEPTQWWFPSRGRERFLPLLRYLAAIPVTGAGAHLETATRKWQMMKPRRGLVVLVSDLWGFERGDALRAMDRIRYGRHELAVIQVMDEAEQTAGAAGEYELVDAEYGHRRKIILDRASAKEFDDNFKRYQEEIRAYCRRYRVPLLQINTRLPVFDLLLKSLQQGGFVK